jgi:CubicO group peptidase (beta-lactamase class C family)
MISGYCDEKFSSARELFEKNLNTGFERGAAITVEIEGETVVDLWGGIDSEEQNTTWQEDTIVNVFSTTKGLAAVCLLQLVEEGKVNLDDPVAKYWPEFAQEGKDKIPVRYLFCHKSGLCGVTTPLPDDAYYNWDIMVNALAAQKPQWEPGRRHGYHALTYGHLIGEMVRRITGQSIGQYFNEKIAEPLNLDFWIGLPDEQFDKVTDIQPSLFPLWTRLVSPFFKMIPKSFLQGDLALIKDFEDPTTIAGSAFNNPKMEIKNPFYANTREWRKAEIPAANGHGSARAIAKFYGVLSNGGNRNGVHLLSPETIDMARQTESEGADLVLANLQTRFGLGFMLGSKDVSMGPAEGAFGHGGAGGSLGFGDPDNHVSIGFVMNQMHPGITAWETATSFIEKVYESK